MIDPQMSTLVTIFTRDYRIEGSISLVPGSRLTDYIRQAEDFIAVVDARVRTREGAPLFTVEFLDVGRDYIELIMPTELLHEQRAVRATTTAAKAKPARR